LEGQREDAADNGFPVRAVEGLHGAQCVSHNFLA
jgi:hypothetical protein